MTDPALKRLLIAQAYLAPEDIERAEKKVRAEGRSLREVLLSEGILTKDLLGQALAESFGVAFANLDAYPPTPAQVLRIPEEIGRDLRLVVFVEEEGRVVLASDNPIQRRIFSGAAEWFAGKSVTVAYALPEDIDRALAHYAKSLAGRFEEILKAKGRVAPEMLSEIMKDALRVRASDIHFEPRAKEVLVRYRIDGILHEVGRFEKSLFEGMLNRIKILANLRIDEHSSAQDGAIRYRPEGGEEVDLRVSILPTLEGEKAALRVLTKYVDEFTMDHLGLGAEDTRVLGEASRRPFGMILVTGPTGSGKTTSLYVLLRSLNTGGVNITTIEDPVEYKVEGVNQIQVNPQTGMTFAKGLRSIVRQDPNIILVGEIRDRETAEISVNAALTGHLLLSTFHAIDSATAIPRLLEMGVEPFLLASTLELVVSQRLVRRLCPSCRYSIEVDGEELARLLPGAERYFPERKATFYRGRGCASCNNIGYRGRVGVFELLPITPEMREKILANPSAGEIRDLARKQGAKSFFEDGIRKVANGTTTLEELLRVAPN